MVRGMKSHASHLLRYGHMSLSRCSRRRLQVRSSLRIVQLSSMFSPDKNTEAYEVVRKFKIEAFRVSWV
jgi:hypothetical protein